MPAQPYISRVASPNIRLVSEPPDGSAVAGGMQRLGEVASAFGQQLAEAAKTTNVASATTGYIRERADLQTQFENSTDWQNAPGEYDRKSTDLREKWFGGGRFDPQTRTMIDRSLVVSDTSARQSVRASALKRQGDTFVADLNTQESDYLTRAATAPSDALKLAIRGEYQARLDDGVAKGLITATTRSKTLAAYDVTLADAKLAQLIRDNPDEAKKLLSDPKQFASLSPVVREARITAAQAAIDERRRFEARQTAQFDPARAIAMTGRLTSPDQVDVIMQRALIPQESGGNPNAVSRAGAQGLTQIMPETARMMARALGRNDIANLVPDDLAVRLKGDKALNYQLGKAYLTKIIGQVDGSLPAAFVGYHAGEGNAVKYHRAAVAQFGPGYTPNQLYSLIPPSLTDGAKATRDYMMDMVKRLGGDGDNRGLSTTGTMSVANVVGAELASEAAARHAAVQQMIAGARDEAGRLGGVLGAGLPVDPAQLAATKAALLRGALNGDGASARSLRDLEYREQTQPVIQTMQRMAPDEQDAFILAEEAKQARAPFVTPEQHDRLTTMRSVRDDTRRMLAEGPRELLYKSGAATPAPLPASADVSDPRFARTVTEAGAHALFAQQRFGGALKLFTATERPQWKARLAEATATDRIAILGALYQNLPPRVYEAAVSEIAGDGALDQMVGRFAGRDPDTARMILRGAELMSDPAVKPKADDLRKALATKVGGDLFPGAHQQAVIEAALAIYAAERGKAGALWDAADNSGMERAIERAAGGQIVKWNGGRVVLPQGMRDGTFQGVMSHLTDSALNQAGGAWDGKTGTLPAAFIRRNAQLMRTGPDSDRYAVMLPQGGTLRPVLDLAGQVLTLDLPRLARDPDIVFGTGPARGRQSAFEAEEQAFQARVRAEEFRR